MNVNYSPTIATNPFVCVSRTISLSVFLSLFRFLQSVCLSWYFGLCSLHREISDPDLAMNDYNENEHHFFFAVVVIVVSFCMVKCNENTLSILIPGLCCVNIHTQPYLNFRTLKIHCRVAHNVKLLCGF